MEQPCIVTSHTSAGRGGHFAPDLEAYADHDGQFAEAHAVKPSDHPMGEHLKAYVDAKVHHLLRDRHWRLITVIGKHERSSPYIVADNEKNHKPFKWYRPTARVVDHDTLEVACFPGRYYVQHYAIVIATYLALNDGSPTRIRYEVSPDTSQNLTLFSHHLRNVDTLDTVVIGYVDQLDGLKIGDWTKDNQDESKLFSWKKFTASNGEIVVLLGCLVSFWGDIACDLATAIHERGAKCVLYVGKGATLDMQREPNEWLATGDYSTEYSGALNGGDPVIWSSILADDITISNVVAAGKHATIPSPLLCNYEWVDHQKSRGTNWVDCEVGLMAKQCREMSMSFGYLHIVSDNISRRQETYGLWNEHDAKVRLDRKALFQQIVSILGKHFSTKHQ